MPAPTRNPATVGLTLIALLATSLLAVFVVPPAPAHAATDNGTESHFVSLINEERAARGLGRLAVANDLVSVARTHSKNMATESRLHHNPNLASDVSRWQRVSENVGVGFSVTSLHRAFMNSAGHAANTLDPNVGQVGVGVEIEADGRIWVTQIYRLPTRAAVGSRPVPTRAAENVSARSDRFRDVALGNVHRPAIEALFDRGITQGCGPSRFCPDEPVTRAQMASFLTRALNLPRGGDVQFNDVKKSNSHAPAIAALAGSGISRGCGAGRFCPDGAVTRAQMASFLARALDLAPTGNVKRFADVGTDDVHARDIAALAAAGITQGCGPGRYCPDEIVTREQMATFLGRALDL